MQYTQNNFHTNVEMAMKTDIYYKELITASSIIQRINKRKYIAYIILTRKSFEARTSRLIPFFTDKDASFNLSLIHNINTCILLSSKQSRSQSPRYPCLAELRFSFRWARITRELWERDCLTSLCTFPILVVR